MTNVSNDIKEAVKQVYLADVEAIRNLSDIATKINAGTFVFPGNLNVTGSFNYLPKGTIVAFNSTTAPAGWTLCDGSNGSPDLRGKFIRMWTDNSTKLEDYAGNINYNINWSGKNNNDRKYKILKHNINDTGGSDLIALTSENEIPSHSHTLNDHVHSHSTTNLKWWSRSWSGSNGHSDSHPYYKNVKDNNEGVYLKTPDAGGHSHTLTGLGGESFNNQPPYYVLTFIIRYK
jgi:microcystin-dependent protein